MQGLRTEQTLPHPPLLLEQSRSSLSGQALKLGASAMLSEVDTSHNLIGYSWTHNANLPMASKTPGLTCPFALHYVRLCLPLVIPLSVSFHKLHSRKANGFGSQTHWALIGCMLPIFPFSDAEFITRTVQVRGLLELASTECLEHPLPQCTAPPSYPAL